MASGKRCSGHQQGDGSLTLGAQSERPGAFARCEAIVDRDFAPIVPVSGCAVRTLRTLRQVSRSFFFGLRHELKGQKYQEHSCTHSTGIPFSIGLSSSSALARHAPSGDRRQPPDSPAWRAVFSLCWCGTDRSGAWPGRQMMFKAIFNTPGSRWFRESVRTSLVSIDNTYAGFSCRVNRRTPT